MIDALDMTMKRIRGLKTETLPIKARSVVAATEAVLLAMTAEHEYLELRANNVGELLMLEFRASATDTPLLVGHRGANVSALKQVLRIIGACQGYRVVSTLTEPTRGERGLAKKFTYNPAWDGTHVTHALDLVAKCCLCETFEVKAVHMSEVTAYQVQPHFSEIDAWPVEINEPLGVLFDAMGKANGRVVQLAYPSEVEER